MNFCVHCGYKLENDPKFCPGCGKPTTPGAAPVTDSDTIMDKLTSTVNHLTGGEGKVRPPVGKIFGQIFVKHSREEGEEIFVCGTAKTTPRLSESGSVWPTPWLFSRILLAFAAAFLLMYVCVLEFENPKSLSGMNFMGSFAVPIAVLVLFLEMNTPKNISFFTIMKIFLVGGCASLLLTMVLYEIIEVDELDYMGAILVSIVEELAKLGILAFFIHQEKCDKYNVNGLLIGAAVGAGFAAFESAGYAFENLVLGGYEQMVDVILLRAALAPGGHVVWAAMSGYALMLAKEGGPLTSSAFGKASFWKIFLIPLVLHAVWDMPIEFGQEICLVQILCTLMAWVVVLVIINNCLRQVGQIVEQEKAQEPPIA